MKADRAQIDFPMTAEKPAPPGQVSISGEVGPPGEATAAFGEGDTGLTSVASTKENGTAFGRYELRRLLGQGGMGEVHLAFDTVLQRVVALKIPKFRDADPIHRERFQREARAAALLSHPHICPVHDVGEIEQRPYLTMAYIDGPSLAEKLRREGSLPPEASARLVRTIAEAMHHAHGHGILHRDLKPGNIVLNGQGEPVVMDFGLAFRIDAETSERLTEPGLVVGTPSYMPPEQINGQPLGPGSDVYSLGVVLYELSTGKIPFEGPLGKLIAQIQTASPPLPSAMRPGYPPALEAICLKALAKNPEDRFADMQTLADALGDYLDGKSSDALAEAPTAAFRRPKGHRRFFIAGAAGVSILAGAAWVFLGPGGGAPETTAPAVSRVPRQEDHREQIRKLFASMEDPVLKVEYRLAGDRAERIGPGTVPEGLSQGHRGALYFAVSGTGFGHVLDLTNRQGQGGQVTDFGQGDLTVLGSHLFFIGNTREEARFFIQGRPPLSILAPMNRGKGSNHVEFDGSHLLQPKILPAEVRITDAGEEEIARLRNRRLTKKVEWDYPVTKYVIYARPDVAVVPGDVQERRTKFPDIHNLIEYDRQRQNVAKTIPFAALVDFRKGLGGK